MNESTLRTQVGRENKSSPHDETNLHIVHSVGDEWCCYTTQCFDFLKLFRFLCSTSRHLKHIFTALLLVANRVEVYYCLDNAFINNKDREFCWSIIFRCLKIMLLTTPLFICSTHKVSAGREDCNCVSLNLTTTHSDTCIIHTPTRR